MKKNIGTIDKVIRLTLVAVIAALYFTHMITGMVAIIAGALGVIFLLTSLVSVCPLYLPFGISTTKKQ
jgi:hypothetical protein